jgi:hypothetical protein
MAGGKNAIINGGFDYWQRGTSGFTSGGAYNADRWKFYQDGAGVTATITQQALTAGSIVGVDSAFCFQWSVTVAGSGATTNVLYSLVENVQTFAGQTTVLSFYAKSDATRTAVAPTVNQNFGSGGSATVGATVTATSGNPANLTTSWQRFSYTVALPSITGKTVGTSSYLEVNIKLPINTTQVTQVVGVQLEVGSVPTQFSRAGGNIQGELAACQRYYWRSTGVEAYGRVAGLGIAASTTSVLFAPSIPVSMRVYPSSIDYANMCVYDGVTILAASPITLQTGAGSLNSTSVNATVTGAVLYRPYFLAANNNTAGYIGFNAEL